MKLMMRVKFPHEPFNTYAREGKISGLINRILEETKPQAVYFTEHDGTRGALLLVDVDKPSRVPAIAEPWFLSFNADCEFHIVMSPEDLKESGLDEIAKKWGRPGR